MCLAIDILEVIQHQCSADGNWGVLDAGAHWRHLAYTIVPTMCGSNAALYQIS